MTTIQEKLFGKLLALQEKLLSFTQTKQNPFFKSFYTPLEEIHKVMKPLLTEQELLLYHQTRGRSFATVLYDQETSETIEMVSDIPDSITDPQKIGGFMTYMRRCHIIALFNLDTEEDDDGEKTQDGVKQKDGAGIESLKKHVVSKLPKGLEPEEALEKANKYVQEKTELKDFDFTKASDKQCKNALFLLTNKKNGGKS